MIQSSVVKQIIFMIVSQNQPFISTSFQRLNICKKFYLNLNCAGYEIFIFCTIPCTVFNLYIQGSVAKQYKMVDIPDSNALYN